MAYVVVVVVVVVVAVFTGLRAVARRRWASSPGAEFWYTKSARAAGVRLYLHKFCRPGGCRSVSTQSWLRFLSLCFVG